MTPLREPVDPDVDLGVAAQRREFLGHPVEVLLAVAVGGVLGAEARYGLARALPHGPTGFPWATFWTNVLGCALIGALIVGVVERGGHRLARPFLGTGVLGGFTTFSTYAVDTDRLAHLHRPLLAFGYLAVTLVACLAAVAASVVITRRVVRG